MHFYTRKPRKFFPHDCRLLEFNKLIRISVQTWIAKGYNSESTKYFLQTEFFNSRLNSIKVWRF